MNEGTAGKHAQFLWNEYVGRPFALRMIGRRVLVDNIDWLVERPCDHGVMFASNHRSFFDAYTSSFSLYQAGGTWAHRLFFPVRSNFFYEHPLGVAVNFFFGGGTLYPPIFRDPAKAALTKDGVERLVRALGEPGTLVGVHPEGTRKQDDDPYTLLPAQPGVGQIALQARPLVVPIFLNGLGNDALKTVTDSFRPNARRDQPIIVVYGDPLPYDDLAAQKPRAALYKKMSDRMRDAITALGARERELRAACARGEIPDGDPRWIADRPRPG
jgi:1-acyl-sn-glycerol-3-phosphate acyltransferase